VLRHALQRRLQPCSRVHPRIGLWLGLAGESCDDLRHQRAHQLLRIVPVVLAAADEVMRYSVARGLAP